MNFIISKVLSAPRGSLTVEDTDGKKYKLSGGTVAWRCNNPGNLKYGIFAEKYNAIGKDYGGHAVFPTIDHGTLAHYMLLFGEKSVYYNMTLISAINRYAPTSDGNDPSKYANFLSKKLNLPITIKIKDIPLEKRSMLVFVMHEYEGFKTGKITEV